MEVILYQDKYDPHESLDQFLDVLFYHEMEYLASDLMDKGLSPEDINRAVSRSMVAGNTAGLDTRQHFIPVYTQFRGALIRDCKLSKLGYAMVILNADVSNPVVANWQKQLLEQFFAREEFIYGH